MWSSIRNVSRKHYRRCGYPISPHPRCKNQRTFIFACSIIMSHNFTISDSNLCMSSADSPAKIAPSPVNASWIGVKSSYWVCSRCSYFVIGSNKVFQSMFAKCQANIMNIAAVRNDDTCMNRPRHWFRRAFAQPLVSEQQQQQ